MSKDLSDAERFKVAVGERVYLWRLAAGLGRSELAVGAGVSPDYVYRLEQGWANPRLDTLHRIACALDTPLEELLAVSDEEMRPACPPIGRPLLTYLPSMLGFQIWRGGLLCWRTTKDC